MTIENVYAGTWLAKKLINGGYLPEYDCFPDLISDTKTVGIRHWFDWKRIQRNKNRKENDIRIKNKIQLLAIEKMRNEHGPGIFNYDEWDKLSNDEKQQIRNNDIAKLN